MLLEMGERPSILSRGYARKIVDEGVVIVSDGSRVLDRVEHSGDEPQMLARAVPRAAVLVSSSRYAAGRIAESRLGCTVHVLDDGFQHFDLMRDVDLLVAPDASDARARCRSAGFASRSMRPSAADALLVRRRRTQCRRCDRPTLQVSPPSHSRAGLPVRRPIGRRSRLRASRSPQRFFGDLEKAGWKLTGRRSFGDHHHYSEREIEEVARAAKSSGAEVILTTEKDIVRIGVAARTSSRSRSRSSIEPAFAPWLAERLRAVRAPGGA